MGEKPGADLVRRTGRSGRRRPLATRAGGPERIAPRRRAGRGAWLTGEAAGGRRRYSDLVGGEVGVPDSQRRTRAGPGRAGIEFVDLTTRGPAGRHSGRTPDQDVGRRFATPAALRFAQQPRSTRPSRATTISRGLPAVRLANLRCQRRQDAGAEPGVQIPADVPFGQRPEQHPDG